jgi:CheY-like chemotaxis protein
MLLEITGNKTFTAHDGVEAIEAPERHRPEVMLLDIGLPKLNGLEVCRRVREQPWGKDIVVIALTGWGQEEDRRKSQEAGFDGHLVKPVDYDKLLDLLNSLSNGA